jgi:hypothetical protein
MFVQCTQCHRAANICDCPANPAGTVDRISELEKQLAKYKPKWQTGRPPIDGHYWRRLKFSRADVGWMEPKMFFIDWDLIRAMNWDDGGIQWSGPILMPEEEL